MSSLVSMITVCRNSSATIARTITSVLEQRTDRLKVEYIVIDGASSDGTQAIVQSFCDSIDVFKSERDNGIADAFNKGIQAAHGEIIGIINSDDMLLPNALSKVGQFFADHPECEVVHGDILLYDGSKFIKRIKPPKRWWYPWRIVFFNHPATFVKKKIYERHGLFDVDYKYAMDVEIFLRWIKSRVNIHYLPDVLVRMQAGGTSGRNAYSGFDERRKAFKNNDFSPVLVNIQYISSFLVQFVVLLQNLLRKCCPRSSPRAF